MIVRRQHVSMLLSAVLTAVLSGAAPVTPPSGAQPEGAGPSTPIPATKSPEPSAAASPAANPEPAAKSPAAKATASAPPDATAIPTPAAPPAPTGTPASEPAATAAATKPGIISAIKSKGPPPAAKGPGAPAPLNPRYQQIRDRIGALFDTRNAPPGPIDPRTNPFRPAGTAPIVPLPVADGMPPPVVANDDLATLQQAVASLKVRGVVQLGTRLQLVINSGPGKEGTYKEGDIINVSLPRVDAVHVRVRQITRNTVTLALNEAETVLKF